MEGDAAQIPAEAIHPLEYEEDLEVLINEIGERRIVLLGEASHGTSEFYTWRAAISRKLIGEKDFKIIAVEGDWADVYPLNNYIRGKSNYNSAEEALQEFDRWPQWMWANEEIAELSEWLRRYNEGKPTTEQVGFYGLDVYGIWESLEAVVQYLEQTNPEAAQVAHRVQDCFAPYNEDAQAYARATLNSSESCADQVTALMEAVQNTIASQDANDEAAFNALQNARVVAHAESYYRAAARSNSASWNIRDLHMTGTIDRLLDHHGEDAGIVVWEHNTHVGDARATDMANAGMVNVGQLVRERYNEENVYIVGFGTYRGEVIASSGWGNASQVMNVPRAKRNSWEWLLHQHGSSDKIVLMTQLEEQEYYQNRIGHRAIGVVYNPGAESGNYVPSVLPKRYDAFIFIDNSNALQPLR